MPRRASGGVRPMTRAVSVPRPTLIRSVVRRALAFGAHLHWPGCSRPVHGGCIRMRAPTRLRLHRWRISALGKMHSIGCRSSQIRIPIFTTCRDPDTHAIASTPAYCYAHFIYSIRPAAEFYSAAVSWSACISTIIMLCTLFISRICTLFIRP